jgi:hypothetical protein
LLKILFAESLLGLDLLQFCLFCYQHA